MPLDLSTQGVGLQDIPAARIPSSFTRHRLVGLGTVNNTLVKTGPSVLASAFLVNTSAAARFVKFYDKATAPAAGTDTPVATVQLPATTSIQLLFQFGDPFALGLGYATTVLVADSDATAITAGDVIVQLVFL